MNWILQLSFHFM